MILHMGCLQIKEIMTAAALGTLPEWNLADLYASPDDAAFAADMKKGKRRRRPSRKNIVANLRGFRATDCEGAERV